MDKYITKTEIEQNEEIEGKNCMITLTIFSEDPELITYMATHYVCKMCKMLGYKVKNVSTGKHIEANRPHWHIMFNINTQKGKVYKTLNQTLIRKHSELEFNRKELADKFRDTEIKISFIYEGQEKKHKKKVFVYGKSYMRYVFKEYNTYDKIEEDLQYGFTKEELEVLRKQAYQEWLITKDKQQREIEQAIADKDEFIELTSYLESELSIYKAETTEQLIRRCMVSIWKFKKGKFKQGKIKSIRVASVQDQAISWLVFNDYITEDEIVNMTIKI